MVLPAKLEKLIYIYISYIYIYDGTIRVCLFMAFPPFSWYTYIYIYTETNFWPKTRNIIPTKGRVARVPGFSHVELSHTIAERTSRRPYDDAFLGECDVPLHRPDIGLHLHPGFYIPSIHIWWVSKSSGWICPSTVFFLPIRTSFWTGFGREAVSRSNASADPRHPMVRKSCA